MKTKRHALADRREIVGNTQETLAEFVGVQPTTVGRWEQGETSPQLWSRPKLAEALAVPVEQLDTMLAEGQPVASGSRNPNTANEPIDDPEHDPVLITAWNHRGTVDAAAVLTGGDGRVTRPVFLSLTGPALTAPAHQWLVHEPEPLVSGLAGRPLGELVGQLRAMIAELRPTDDLAGGGDVLSLAHYHTDAPILLRSDAIADTLSEPRITPGGYAVEGRCVVKVVKDHLPNRGARWRRRG